MRMDWREPARMGVVDIGASIFTFVAMAEASVLDGERKVKDLNKGLDK